MKIIFLALFLFICLPSASAFSGEESSTVYQQKKRVTDRYQQQVEGRIFPVWTNLGEKGKSVSMIIDVIEMEDELHIYLRKYKRENDKIWKSVKPLTLKFRPDSRYENTWGLTYSSIEYYEIEGGSYKFYF